MTRTPRPVVSEVDLGAIRRNLARIREHLPQNILVIASVKANAYGHGAVEVARELADGSVFAVATASVEEAFAIRESGAHTRVLVFGGFAPGAAQEILDRGLVPTVANEETAKVVRSVAGNRRVFVKVDAGLGRLGVPLAEAAGLVKRLTDDCVAIEGIYTHLPFATAEGEKWAREALHLFGELLDVIRQDGVEIPVTQALSSPGISAGLPNPCNAVCPGRLLYGLAPSVGDAAQWGLEPALRRIVTEIVHIGRHREGSRIGAGGSIPLSAETLVGVVPFGHANGYRLPAYETLHVLHRGQRRQVLGVSLEHTTINLDGGPAEIGDEVILLGRSGEQELTTADIADAYATSPLELLVSLSGRTHYTYLR